MLTVEETRIQAALVADLGKPSIEGYAADIKTVINDVVYIRKHTEKWAKPRRVSLPLRMRPGKAWIRPEPLGVALVIAPWNYPVQLVIEPLAAALAAGNTVVVKPSELAPATSAMLAELIPRYVDNDAVAVVEGDATTSTALLQHRFDHIFFTGSPGVGQVVMEAAAKHLTPVTLELGGKSPAIVTDSADVEVAARRLAWGKWLNAGQTCIAPDYVLVTEAHREQLVDSLGSALLEFSKGNTRTNIDYTRIVNERHARRLQDLLVGHGGTVTAGGDADPARRYVEPTVIVDPDPDSALMTEEIFGPILPVLTVASVEDAVEFVNAREKPLALYVFGDDAAAGGVIDATTSGGTCVNHVLLQVSVPRLPFGGVGQSGTGRYRGRAGFDTFSNLRSIMKKNAKPDPKLGYPPYTNFKEWVLRKLL